MLNGHVFHAFTRTDLRSEAPYIVTQFIGGMPPAAFLFLVGVTLSFLMESRERQGVAAPLRVWAALRRSGYLFGIAFLFRIQMWAFGLPGSNWRDLFRVDVLNSMGFAIAVLSVLAVLRTVERVRLGAVLGLAIAFCSPLVSAANLGWIPGPIRAYLVPDSMAFGFFPWGAFVAFGISAGSIIRLVRRDELDRLMQWSALAGLMLIVGGRYFSSLPYSFYAKSDFWLNGPWLIIIKLGILLLILPAAYLWCQYGAVEGWSWIRQFGTTSLLVYWVHTEIVYGRWLSMWQNGLATPLVVLLSLAVILSMLGLSVLKTNWGRMRLALPLVPRPFGEPRRVPGD
jgi:uncharacterized membrane protein